MIYIYILYDKYLLYVKTFCAYLTLLEDHDQIFLGPCLD